MDSLVLIHRAAGKMAFYLQSEPLSWSDELRCWVTCEPDLIEQIQRNTLFRVVDHSGETTRIMSRLGVDLSHIARVFENVPVNVEGDEHAARRRRMATALAARTDESLARFERLARLLCEKHLNGDGKAELVRDLFEPLTIELALALSGIALQPDPDYISPTQIFDKALGLSRRKVINRQIGAMRERACRVMPEFEADTAVALAILGSDTILGSLALSFAERVSCHPGLRLCDIEWGERLTVTAVPFIERQAVAATLLGGVEIAKDDKLRLYLDRFTFESAEKRDSFFGTGRHTCTGRAVAQQAWRLLANILGSPQSVVRIDKVALREADCMFLFPSEIQVTVHGN